MNTLYSIIHFEINFFNRITSVNVVSHFKFHTYFKLDDKENVNIIDKLLFPGLTELLSLLYSYSQIQVCKDMDSKSYAL